MSTLERVVSIVERYAGKPGEFKADTVLRPHQDLDSLDVVEMLLAVEDEFGIEIPDDEAEQLMTVGQIVEYVDKRLAA